MKKIGKKIYGLCENLFYINRSLTGNGVRKTLEYLKKELPNLTIHEVPSGTKCFDWEIPKEWNIKDAYIKNEAGKKIIDFNESNIHVVGYSSPIHKTLDLDELDKHLYTLPELPEAIPYITSYYKETWGFCMSHKQRQGLTKGKYKVHIDSSLEDGSLTYAELFIKGESKKEIFISTYICHPSLANDNLSGPALVTYLAKHIQSINKPRYSYRIIFIPETIGAIAYLDKNMDALKKNVIAGFVVTCVGDNNHYSYLASRQENSLADNVALHVLKYQAPHFKKYSYLDRGSDERQYCAPNVDLPVCSVMRTKYGEFDEYHTSLDNLDFINSEGFNGSFNVYEKMITALEQNFTYNVNVICEPQLGKRGLYPTISTRKTAGMVKNLKNLLVYCDGKHNLLEVAEKINVPIWDLYDLVGQLVEHNLISIKE